MMNQFNKDKGIEDVDDFNCYVEEQFTCFLIELIKDPSMTRPINEDDDVGDDEVKFIYTNKAIKIIDRYKSRIHKIGEAHFPNDLLEIECESYMYKEF